MNISATTPIAFFAFKRPQHTRQALETLSNCYRLDECPIFIYCDGPVDVSQIEQVRATRQVVKTWAGQHRATVIERSENLGLARSIVTGVTKLCQEFGRVIVLENDLLVSPVFLDFILQSLDYYESAPLVYQISGYMYPVLPATDLDAVFFPVTSTWGWATWKRAWQIFDVDSTEAREFLANPHNRFKFDLGNSYPFSTMLEERLDGKNNSWGVLWYYSVFKAGGLTLYPRRSLVQNIGFDGSGTHAGESNMYDIPESLFLSHRRPGPFSFPQKPAIDQKVIEQIGRYFRDTASPTGPPASDRLRLLVAATPWLNTTAKKIRLIQRWLKRQ